MYHVTCIDIHKKDPLYPYLDRACLCANNMYNVSNFYIRNLMTGLRKDLSARTVNERDVIDTVTGSIPGINEKLREKHDLKVRNILKKEGLSEQERADRAAKVKCVQFSAPTAAKWFASYGLLDAVFKYTDNADYRSFHIHVMQHAIKECCQAWKGHFEGLKAYDPSGHAGKPKIPGYKRSGGRTAAVFSNIACSIKHGMLFFPCYREEKDAGKKRKRCGIPVRGILRASEEKLIEVRAVPYFGLFQLQIVTDDGIPEEALLPDEKDIIHEDGSPSGVMMLDPGLNNFASIADNKGNMPIVIKGGAIKACNQWYNKRMAALRSAQMKGHDPKTYHPPMTRQMERISRKRDAILRDAFYKYAHYIFRLMEERGLSYLIVGYNREQKQGMKLVRVGRANV